MAAAAAPSTGAPSLSDLKSINAQLKAELAHLEALAKETNIAEHKLAQLSVESGHDDTSIRDPAEIKLVFDQIDTDHSGFIDRNELASVALRLGEVLDDDELDAAMQEIDTSQDTKISFEEFSSWWLNPSRTRVSKTAVKVGVLRARIVASNLLRGAPKLLRVLSEHKQQVVPPDSREWVNHKVHLSVGEMKEAKAAVRFHIDFKSPSNAGFESFPGHGVVVRINLTPKAGQSASERAAAAEALRTCFKSPGTIQADTTDPNLTVLSVGLPIPDPLAMAAQVNLDVKNFVRQLSFSLELGHTLGEFIDTSTPSTASLASLIVARLNVDVQFRKALVYALAEFPIPGIHNFLPLAWLEATRLQLKFGDFGQFASSFTVQEGVDPLAEIQRQQQLQLQQFQAMGFSAAMIEEMKVQQQQQLQQMQSVVKNPLTQSQFWLDQNFKPKLRSLYHQLIMNVVSGQPKIGALFHCLSTNFSELNSVVARSPSGLFVEATFQDLFLFKYLPTLTKSATGQWVVMGEVEGQ